MTSDDELDLGAYLARVGYRGPRDPSRDVLEALQAAHLGHIPFENVDVILRRPIRLDLESLQRKLVSSSRGGYCFEQNTLFAAALRALGFEVSTLEARVLRPGSTEIPPRTHMTLKVTADDRSWLVDVGFGGDTPLLPVPLDRTVSSQPLSSYRVDGGPPRVLRAEHDGTWTGLYSFTEEPAQAVDFEVANHYTSTHPRSRFVRTLTLQLATPAAVHVVRGRVYSMRTRDEERTKVLSDARFKELLRDPFGLALADDEVAELLRVAGRGAS